MGAFDAEALEVCEEDGVGALDVKGEAAGAIVLQELRDGGEDGGAVAGELDDADEARILGVAAAHSVRLMADDVGQQRFWILDFGFWITRPPRT